jgi:hypothetical protein
MIVRSLPIADLNRAAEFVWRHARLLDRHRFAYLFLGGDKGTVMSALRAYQNADGGFGNALEPDLRAPDSQPVPVWSALEILDEIKSLDDPMVAQACDYLSSVSCPDGGVPFVLASAQLYPRAPWWQPAEQSAGALVPTAGIVGLLSKRGVQHPWLDGARTFCWRRIDALQLTGPYDVKFALRFLEQEADQGRARQAVDRIGPMLLERDWVALDPAAQGDVHLPLEFAPRPDSLARALFTDSLIETHLDALAAGQQPDGGWTFNWLDWNPASTAEWRAIVTIQASKTLRAYGRLGK